MSDSHLADRPQPGILPLSLVAWKPVCKGALRGFASVRLGRVLVLHECPVLAGQNGPWATLPGKPVLDSEGQHKRNDRGKPLYVAVGEWVDRDMRERFSAAVVEAVTREFPDDLDPGARP